VPKKIFILHASAGSGHKKAAEAIEKTAKNQGLDVEVKDVASFMSPFSKWLYCDGYLFLISKMAWLWGVFYFLSDIKIFSLVNVYLRRFADAVMCRRLTAYLLKEKPEVVVVTQFLAAEIVSMAKIKYGLNCRLITVVTDFGVHRFWINPETDMYACATLATKKILLDQGVVENRIAVTGIPLDEKFTRSLTQAETREEFYLDKRKFTVLIATGGIGVGPIEDIVELLKETAQLLVVCGSNKNLYDNLAKKNYRNVRIFGFVDFMQKLMKASDVIVTKAGGLTVTESLAMGLPMVYFFLIPGQEEINARTLAAEGAGFIAKSPEEIKQFVLTLKNNSALFETYKSKALSLAKPDSCKAILSLVS
jgi:processive 1,2-diacylglycerol beta-glucosyltransferase